MNYPAHKVLSAYDLADLIRESNQHGQRFCFILGPGASVESGIPSVRSLEMTWMNYLMGEGRSPDPTRSARTRRIAASMKAERLLEHEFSELEHVWREAKEKGQNILPSRYYFDIYRLRFYPHKANGYRYMEEVMERAKPSIGYHTLSLLLTDTNLNNLLITTNLDSLVEDALAIYSDKRPLVIAHESLASYMELDTKCPIIAKVYWGLFFEPFNSPYETNELRKEWREAFSRVFERCAPIVIGYGGDDRSLMSFLEAESTQMRHGIFWCIRAGTEPAERVRRLVDAKDGCFVEIPGFDGLMLALGSALYGNTVIPTGKEPLDQFVLSNEADVVEGSKMNNSVSNSITNSTIKPTLFLSYCSKDTCIADIIENTLNRVTSNQISISRYTRVPYRESFKTFMNGIQEHDFVLCVVSDSYLRSQACMYEVGEIVKIRKYEQKLLFVVLKESDRKFYPSSFQGAIAADIYGEETKRLKYVSYWVKKYDDLHTSINAVGDIEATSSATNKLKEIGQIYRHDISEFLEFLADHKGKSFEELYSGRFSDIIKIMIPDSDTAPS